MTARVGGGALIAAGQGVGNLGQALMQAAAQRHAEELAQQQQAAEEHYREQMLGVQRDQLAQGDRHFGETLEQNYRTHGFSPGGGSAPSTGDALLDLAGGSQPAPLSLGAHLMGAATGRERPSPSTRSGWVYDPTSDPDVVRQRAHDSAASAEAAADRASHERIAGIAAGSRERVAGMRGSGSGASRTDRDNANGVAAALVQQHGGIDGADSAAAAMPASREKDLVVAALHDLRYDVVHHNTVTPAHPRAARPSLAEIAARLQQPPAH